MYPWECDTAFLSLLPLWKRASSSACTVEMLGRQELCTPHAWGAQQLHSQASLGTPTGLYAQLSIHWAQHKAQPRWVFLIQAGLEGQDICLFPHGFHSESQCISHSFRLTINLFRRKKKKNMHAFLQTARQHCDAQNLRTAGPGTQIVEPTPGLSALG